MNMITLVTFFVVTFERNCVGIWKLFEKFTGNIHVALPEQLISLFSFNNRQVGTNFVIWTKWTSATFGGFVD
jgi:hypothetical protein